MEEDSATDEVIIHMQDEKNKIAENKIYIACLGAVLFISYSLNYKVDCEPRMDVWLYRMRIILLVILFGGITAWVKFGKFIKNIGKICKGIGLICSLLYDFVGIYMVLFDETCLKDWPLGFFTVGIISFTPICLIFGGCAMRNCFLILARYYKTKVS